MIPRMQTVKIRKDDLLVVVKKNREEHRKIFLEACDGYRKEAVEVLDRMLADAKAGKRVEQFIGLEEPVDQTKDYDRVIRMLEMSTDDVITLTQGEFSNYVLDDWSWKQQFMGTNIKYVNSNRTK
jgi:hypothetical protein